MAGGKTWVIVDLAKKLNEPILILVPSKELLEQNLEKLLHIADRSEIGVFSASMGEHTIRMYTLATIQSAYKNPELFKGFKVAIIDEADLLNPKSLDGMYNKFFKEIGCEKVYGLTATPYRLDSYYERWGAKRWQVKTITTIKMINRYQSRFWDRMLYVINTNELLDQGFLCKLEYVDDSLIEHEDLKMNKSHSDFDLTYFEQEILEKEKKILTGVEWAKRNYNSTLVFCSSIEQAHRLSEQTDGSAVITGTTPPKQREKTILDFRLGDTKVIFNVNVLTVGFDHPELGCIIMVRPTRSIRLYQQMLGRGMRLAEGKKHCLVMDFSGNVKNIGKLATIETKKIVNVRGNVEWNVVSEKCPGGYHYKKLYEFKPTSKTQKVLQGYIVPSGGFGSHRPFSRLPTMVSDPDPELGW